MKTNLICVILCLCVLLTIPFGAQADNPGEMGNPTGSTVATESTSQDTTTPEQPTVVKQDITYCTVSLGKSSYTYNGAERKPSVTVSSGDVVFKKGKDYTVSYENNVNAGTAKVFVSEKKVDRDSICVAKFNGYASFLYYSILSEHNILFYHRD